METLKPIKIEIVKSPFKSYGYSLKHNQKQGWHGTKSNTFAWYRYKSDAEKAKIEIETTWR